MSEVFQVVVVFVQGVDAGGLTSVLVDVCGPERAQDGDEFWKQGIEGQRFCVFGGHERLEAGVVFEEFILASVEE